MSDEETHRSQWSSRRFTTADLPDIGGYAGSERCVEAAHARAELRALAPEDPQDAETAALGSGSARPSKPDVSIRGVERVLVRSEGDPTKACRDRVLRLRPLSPERRERLARLFVSALEAPADADPDSDDVVLDPPQPLQRPLNNDLAAVTQALEDGVCAGRRISRKNPNPGSLPSKREDRAMVPTSHGTGFRYDWKITSLLADALCEEVETQRALGWRVGYMAGIASSAYMIDVLWLRDDDCNFNSGVLKVRYEDLANAKHDLLTRAARPIGVLFQGPILEDGYFLIAWVQDGKYISDQDWRLEVYDIHETSETFKELREAGYRIVSATLCLSSYAVIWVRDAHAPAWALWVFETDEQDFDPIAAFQTKISDEIIPISLDVKVAYMRDGIEHAYWLVLAMEDPDLDTRTDPNSRWDWIPNLSERPDRKAQLAFQAAGQRLDCFTSVRYQTDEGPKTRCVVVQCDVPRMHCRVIYDFESGDDQFPDDSLAEIEDLTFLMMSQTKCPAATIAIADRVSGWRVRAGFTRAPLAYPDTYPETRFRVGSVSKLLTALGTWAALVTEAKDELDALPVFDVLPSTLQPSVGALPKYPPGIMSVTVGNCLDHTSGWADSLFHVYNSDATGGLNDKIARYVASGLPDVMEGWKTDANDDGTHIGLTPLLGVDMMLWFLRSEVFTQNISLTAPPGWNPAFLAPPQAGYSGFGYLLLAGVIEALMAPVSPSYKSAIRGDFEGYAQWIHDAVLEPCQMPNTHPGRSPRTYASPNEAIYRAGTYLEEEQLFPNPSQPFGEGHLYRAEDNPNISCDMYPLGAGNAETSSITGYGEDVPLEAFSPPFGTQAHGAYRTESLLPAGGWVSTAPDLAKLAKACTIFSPVVPAWVVVNKIASAPVAPSMYTRGGLQAKPLGYLGKDGWAPYARGLCYVHMGTARQVGMCRLENPSTGAGSAWVAALLALIAPL